MSECNLISKFDYLNESKKRVMSMTIGEPVTNICAGEGNPIFHSYFVELITKTRRNKYGIDHSEYTARCTNKKNKFWNIDIKVIYPGHLTREVASKLFDPIWDMEHGKKPLENKNEQA
jgi:hypothetical protein